MQVNSKLEVVSELRSDVLALMTSVSEMSRELLDLRVEVRGEHWGYAVCTCQMNMHNYVHTHASIVGRAT